MADVGVADVSVADVGVADVGVANFCPPFDYLELSN